MRDIRWRENWLTANLVLAPFLFGCVETWSRSLVEVSYFALAASCLAGRGRIATGLPPLVWAALGVAFIGLVQSASPGSADAGVNVWLPSTVSSWASAREARTWAACACAGGAASVIVSDRDSLRRMVRALFAAGVVFAIAGIIQWGRAHFEIFGLRPVRFGAEPFGAYYNRNHAAGFMAVCVALGAGLVASRVGGRRRESLGRLADVWSAQILVLGGVGLLLVAIWLTNSRGAMLGLALGSALALFPAVRRRGDGVAATLRRWLPGAVLVAAVVGAMAASGRSGLARLGMDASAEARVAIWRAALGMIGDRPLWGFGLGGFEFAFPPYHVDPALSAGAVEHAHSDWLEFAVGLGAVGSAVIAWGLLAHARRLIAEWMKVEDRQVRALWGGCIGGVFVLGIHSFVEFNLQIPASFFLVAAMCCFCFPLRRAPLPAVVGRASAAGGGTGGTALRGLTAGLVAACALLSATAGASWWYAWRAEDADLRERARLLETATFLARTDPDLARELGVVYLWLGDETRVAKRIFARKALAAAERGLTATPAHAGLLEVKGTALWWLGRASRGKLELDRSAKLRPWERLRPSRRREGS